MGSYASPEIPLPKNLSRKIARFLVSKIGPATGVSHGTYVNMGWLRLVGSIKLQVSSAEYRLFCRALLQKRPII